MSPCKAATDVDLRHLILGLLRPGAQRHGWDLYSEYRRRTGADDNHGNFYKNLRGLVDRALLVERPNPAGADRRRIPYEITPMGKAEFDSWMRRPATVLKDLAVWLMFVDGIPSGDAVQLLTTCREERWIELKRAMLDWDRMLTKSQKVAPGGEAKRPDPVMLATFLQLKELTAEIEAIAEIIQMIQAGDEG